MDASLCREHLATLLDEEATALHELEAILNQEHQYITGDKLEELEQAGRQRESCMASLLRIDSERQSLCRAGGFSTDKIGLAQLLNWCDPSGSVQRRWGLSTLAIRQCRDLNDRNGALVNNRLRRVEGVLDTLKGNPGNSPKVYSTRGSLYQNTPAGRVCNIQD